MAEVVLKNICKVYGQKVQAVKNCNIEIKDKEFVVLVGPSGCGKTTTLRMIAGLEDITDGELLIDGKVVNNIPPKDRDIAMVFQNYALYPHMSVYENMAFGLKIRKVSKKEIDERVHEAAGILGIEDLLKRKPRALSGGQRQRVAVGRAIVRQPKVFLFDEPLSNLDAKLRVQMRAEISSLHEKLQATMIYVTHDQVEALTMADRIVVMKDGEVQQSGSPMELYNNPANMFVAGFIGTPPMNFMDVTVESEGGSFYLNEGSFRLKANMLHDSLLRPYTGKKIVMGLRPEDFTFCMKGEVDRTINGTVSVVEPLGSETNVFVSTPSNVITGRISPTAVVQKGSSISLLPTMAKAKFFDPETTKAIV